MDSEKMWYVIHTYSGYENKVKANLERKVQSMGMENEIFNILVPMEDEVEIKDGRKKVIKRKVFPGYVLVEMVMDAGIIFLVQVRLQLLLESRHIWNRMMFLVQ